MSEKDSNQETAVSQDKQTGWLIKWYIIIP